MVGDIAADTESLGFDPHALREKYKQERDRRIRPDAEDQYVELTGKFAHYAETDPYVEPGYQREAMSEEMEVAIIGGGFSGLLAGARLREQGVQDFRIIEAGGDFGGTWYWNRYPGAQCDIESYCYLPLLEETGYIPKEKYSYGAEIFEHSRHIGEKYDLYERTIFQTRVRQLRWDEEIKRWHIVTNRGDDIKARFVVMAVGVANRAKLPGIPGIQDFEGHTFHTSRWDYEYTGGGPRGGLDKLADKTVAVVGTGATAIQCVPYVGRSAKQTYVVQRTPSSVDMRGNKPTDYEWAKSLEPGWQRARRHNFADIVEGRPFEVDMVADGWTDIFRSLASGTTLTKKPIAELTAEDYGALAELADFVKMNKVRARVDEIVTDKSIAETLKPWYRQFCKRPTFNDEYLPTFNLPNVELVDVSASHGIERITPKGFVANGKEYEVDCIIFASGFEIGTGLRRRIGFEILGRDGVSIYDHHARGLRTLHGHSSVGFPNLFSIGVGHNALSVNMTAMFDDQAKHVAYIIAEVKRRNAVAVEATPEGEEAWAETIRANAYAGRDFLESCTPGYYNNEGRQNSTGFSEIYTPGLNKFNELLADWRDKGALEGMQIHY